MSLKFDPTYRIEEAPKPPRRNSPGEILVFLLGSGIVLGILLVPGVNSFFRSVLLRPARPALDPAIMVWTNKNTGVYYCAGNKFYGLGPGQAMKQGDALSRGYQPALGNYCSPSGRTGAERRAPAGGVFGSRRTSESRSSNSVVTGSL